MNADDPADPPTTPQITFPPDPMDILDPKDGGVGAVTVPDTDDARAALDAGTTYMDDSRNQLKQTIQDLLPPPDTNSSDQPDGGQPTGSDPSTSDPPDGDTPLPDTNSTDQPDGGQTTGSDPSTSDPPEGGTPDQTNPNISDSSNSEDPNEDVVSNTSGSAEDESYDDSDDDVGGSLS